MVTILKESLTLNCQTLQSGDVYNYEFVVWSPLVLDFKVSGSPDLTTTFGGVEFDLNADGVLDKSAWIQGSTTGLLVYDRNTEKEVQSISLSYNENSLEKQFSVADSNIKYSAKFTGPKICGDKGCNIHDIYFGKINAKDKLAAE